MSNLRCRILTVSVRKWILQNLENVSTCVCSVYQAFPFPPLEGLEMSLAWLLCVLFPYVLIIAYCLTSPTCRTFKIRNLWNTFENTGPLSQLLCNVDWQEHTIFWKAVRLLWRIPASPHCSVEGCPLHVGSHRSKLYLLYLYNHGLICLPAIANTFAI